MATQRSVSRVCSSPRCPPKSRADSASFFAQHGDFPSHIVEGKVASIPGILIMEDYRDAFQQEFCFGEAFRAPEGRLGTILLVFDRGSWSS
jgi:hypothetical protein